MGLATFFENTSSAVYSIILFICFIATTLPDRGMTDNEKTRIERTIHHSLRWLPIIPENVKLLRTHSPVTKFILNTPKYTSQYTILNTPHNVSTFRKNMKAIAVHITKNRNKISVVMITKSF